MGPMKKTFIVTSVCLFLAAALNNSAAQTSDDSNYSDMLQVTSSLSVYYKLTSTNSGSSALSVKAVYQGLAWLGIGVNSAGEMVGGNAVIIGKPDEPVSSVNPGKYTISDRSADGVVLMDSSAQTLFKGSITQYTSSGTATLSFTKILDESGENAISKSKQTTFIYAIGSDSPYPAYHGGGRGSFKVDLSGATPAVVGSDANTKNYTKIFAAHGIMAVIAWAFLTPIAIASSFLRSLFSTPLWFKIHMYFNCITFVLTLTAFILAVANTPREKWFGKPHFVSGWVLMGLLTFNVLAGIFRPNANKDLRAKSVSEQVKNTLNGVKGCKIRPIWEVLHKLIGYGTLGLALLQMQSGLKLWKSQFGTNDYLIAYWSWIVCFFIAVLFLKLFSYRRWTTKNKTKNTEDAISSADPGKYTIPGQNTDGVPQETSTGATTVSFAKTLDESGGNENA